MISFRIKVSFRIIVRVKITVLEIVFKERESAFNLQSKYTSWLER